MTAIVFDLDGTLIDSAPDIHAAVTLMLAEEGAQALPFKTVLGFIGNGVPALIGKVMVAQGEAPSTERQAVLVARFLRHYEAAPANLTTVYPGVFSALTALAAAGHPMGVCTNKPYAAAQSILVALDLDKYFQIVLGGDSLPQRKPHPEPLHATIRQLGGGPAVYVGDSEVDEQTARAAGVPLLLYTLGYRHTPLDELMFQAEFDDFNDLPGLVSQTFSKPL